ncbi:MAG TPA: hypothetical protein VLX92_22550 [Kofleriaceae bacterium]|nr:hypothetical protein [Kofleriaceae bacterium]
MVGVGLAATIGEVRADNPKPSTDARTAVLDALAVCLAKGALCVAHCQAELAGGHTELAKCSQAVLDMTAVANAAQSLIARQSPNAKRIADLCATTCKACSAACLEHKAHWAHGMHLECRACMEACDDCAKACAAYASS